MIISKGHNTKYHELARHSDPFRPVQRRGNHMRTEVVEERDLVRFHLV